MKITLKQLKQIIKEESTTSTTVVPLYDTVDDIKLYTEYDVLETLLGKDYWQTQKYTYEDEGEIIERWAEENDAIIYERPREEFDELEAVHIAKQSGASAAILNDLS